MGEGDANGQKVHGLCPCLEGFHDTRKKLDPLQPKLGRFITLELKEKTHNFGII